MLSIDLGGAAPGRLRFAISPLWETLSAALLVARYKDNPPWPYTSWFVSIQPRLADTEIRELIARLAEFADVTDLPCPPPPTASAADIADELRAVRGTPLSRFAAGLDRFWQVAIAPRWSDVRATLENEVLFRARILATEGGSAVLRTLHSRMDWQPPTLTIAGAARGRHDLGDRTLVLVPLLFGRGQPLLAIGSGEAAALSYQARGAAVLARATGATLPGSARPDRLAALVGRTRAAVIRSIAIPTTTTAIAQRLGLAASTVSEHLATLVDAGVARRARAGVRVLYELDGTGVRLLDAVDRESA